MSNFMPINWAIQMKWENYLNAQITTTDIHTVDNLNSSIAIKEIEFII